MGVRTRGKARLAPLLSAHHFSPSEVAQFSTLGRMTPTLKAMIRERDIRRRRFENLAAGKIARGVWAREETPRRWWANVARMYRSRGWITKYAIANTPVPIGVGKPNPWGWYRACEKTHPDPKHVSPWVLGRRHGKTKLERGLMFVEVLEQRTKQGNPPTSTQLRLWIGQKENAVAKARGQRKAQLKVELGRLERLLERST